MLDIKESEMEDLLERYAGEFFPRKVLNFKNRQGIFAGVGRYDLLFEDEFNNNILIELKAVTAKLDVADQLVKYKQALENKGEKSVVMWLIAPLVPKHVADFLDRFGVEHTEIHVAEFRQVASRHGYLFSNDSISSSSDVAAQAPVKIPTPPNETKLKQWSFASTPHQGRDAKDFLTRCDDQGKTFFALLFEKQKSFSTKTRITWNHQSGFSMQFYFNRLGFIELVWGFPAMNREGKATRQRITFPFDFAEKKNVSEGFINDFGNAIAALVPLTGGKKRLNMDIGDFKDNDAQRVVDTIFEFVTRASIPG